MKLRPLGMALAALLIGIGSAQATIIVDDFSCPGVSELSNTTNSTTVMATTDTTVCPPPPTGIAAIGGSRDKEITVISGATPGVVGAEATVIGGTPGVFLASTDAGVAVSTAAQSGGTDNSGGYLLRYDAFDAGLSLNFNSLLVNGFEFDLLENDFPLRVYVELCSGATNTCLVDTFTKPVVVAGMPLSFFHPLTAFGPMLDATFKSDIDSIAIRLHSTAGLTGRIDLALDNIRLTQVPEPSTLLLMGGSLLGLGLARFLRRPRNNK